MARGRLIWSRQIGIFIPNFRKTLLKGIISISGSQEINERMNWTASKNEFKNGKKRLRNGKHLCLSPGSQPFSAVAPFHLSRSSHPQSSLCASSSARTRAPGRGRGQTNAPAAGCQEIQRQKYMKIPRQTPRRQEEIQTHTHTHTHTHTWVTVLYTRN